ncbi:MAG: hypothetical protein HXY39_03815 [Chloroflexi bacterium]|nr:hypothetical protein [Chloroflexota bacterium]
MSSDSYDTLRRAVVEALGSRPAPERRRQIAAELRALAEQQERMALHAEQRATGASAPPAGQAAPETRERSAGMYVRIRHESDPQTGTRRIRLLLGKPIWFELGSPERITIQRVGTEIWIVAARGAGGLRLSTDIGLPGCIVPKGDPLEQLPPGRYAATLRAGALIVGARVAQ